MRSRTHTTVRAFAAAGLASLALAGTATAADYEYYGVEVDATVHTEYTGSAHTETLRHDSSLSVDTQVRAGFLAIIERDATGRIIGATGAEQHDATTTGTAEATERLYARGWDDWYEYGSSCVGGGENKNDEGRTSLRPDPLTPLVGGALILNLADRLAVELDCDHTGRHGGAGPTGFVLESPLPEDELMGPDGPLAVAFDLPPEATAAGKVIQLYEGPAAAYCPEDLAQRDHVRSCNVTFRGTITLTKTDLGGREQPRPQPRADPVPVPAPRPVPAPAPRPAPAPDSNDDLLAPLVPQAQRASIDARGAQLSFRAACPAGCSGSATVLAPATAGAGGKAKAAAKGKAAKPRKLAVIRFAVPRGARARTIRLTVPRRARAALRAARGKATVKLVLKARGGPRLTRTLKTAAR